jgi:dTDP-4-amino-4,6-dideoxygalactose transaminase
VIGSLAAGYLMETTSMPTLQVPFFRPDLTRREIDEVVETLESGWLTTGPRVKRFETDFATAVSGRHAVAVNSCTAALHLAVEALGLRPGDGVLVPTMTFAATAEVIRYQGAVPILVDCEPETLNISVDDAARKLEEVKVGRAAVNLEAGARVVGMIPVHVGGMMADVGALRRFAAANDLWIVEDAAHAFPAAWRPDSDTPWQRCGQATAAVT